MICKNRKGQSLTEFVILLPLLLFFLLGIFQIGLLAIKSQKLDMAAYYAARVYSKNIIRGIQKGSSMQLDERRREVLAAIVIPKVKQYLNTNDVSVTIKQGNMVSLEWPVIISMGAGKFSFIKQILLKSEAEMENEPLEYGGGRYYKTLDEEENKEEKL